MFHNFFEHAFEGGGGHHHRQRYQERKNVDTEAYYTFMGFNNPEKPLERTKRNIKKQYRVLAKTLHPDRPGGSEDKFKKLNKIYGVLSDDEKRALYDKGGEEAVEKGDAGGGDPFDFFGGGRSRNKKKKGHDQKADVNVTLEDLYRGAKKVLRYRKVFLCEECNGMGGKNVKRCRDCNGNGVKLIQRSLGPGMVQQIQTHCGECEGKGEIIPKNSRCKKCRGEKVVRRMAELNVHINKGMKHNSKIKFREEANQSPDTTPGDLIVRLQMREHKRFHREGAHLFYKKNISLIEALSGFEFTIETLEKRTLIVKSEPDVLYNPGCVRAVRDEGMPQETNPSVRGNLYIIINVVFPSELDDRSIAKLKSAFPENKRSPKPGNDLEDVTLKQVDIKAERKRWKLERQEKSQYDSDDEAPRGQTAQCHAQ